jgi:hypothetical protein
MIMRCDNGGGSQGSAMRTTKKNRKKGAFGQTVLVTVYER